MGVEIWTNEIAFILKPGSFTLSSDAGIPDDNGMFNVTWTVSSEATEYNIYQHTSSITELTGAETLIAGGVTANTFPLTSLTNGTYYYIVESTNTYGKTLSNCIEITVEIPPEPTEPSGPGIPGYEMFIVFGSIFLTMEIIAIITIRKKRLL